MTILSCDVDFGSSGAPVFEMIDGEPKIVSVVSAKAEMGGKKVALGSEMERPLEELRAAYAANTGAFQKVAPAGGSHVFGQSAVGSAKFVRP